MEVMVGKARRWEVEEAGASRRSDGGGRRGIM